MYQNHKAKTVMVDMVTDNRNTHHKFAVSSMTPELKIAYK